MKRIKKLKKRVKKLEKRVYLNASEIISVHGVGAIEPEPNTLHVFDPPCLGSAVPERENPDSRPLRLCAFA